MKFRDILNRLPEIFLDDSTKVSSAKVYIPIFVFLIVLLVISYVGFAIVELCATRKMPPIPEGLSLAITALGGVISILYSANKFSPTIEFKKEEKEEIKE